MSNQLLYRRWFICLPFILSASSVQLAMSSSDMYPLATGATTTYQGCIRQRRMRKVDVTDVSIVCDRIVSNDDDQLRGYNYYNKPTCLAGDVGKLAIAFTLKNEMPYNSTIYMSMEAFSHGRNVTIQNRTDVCSFPNLGFVGKDGVYYESSENGGLCPLRSDLHYLLLTSFTVPELFHRDAIVEFIPNLMLLFYATGDPSSPVIGCVETGTMAQLSLEHQRANQGAVALFVSIVCFVGTFALCIHRYSSQRRQDADVSGTSRMASIIRRNRYRKNNPNNLDGSISLVPSLSEGRPISSSSGNVGRSMSSSHDPPRSRSERTISTHAKSFSSRSEHSILFLPHKEDVL
ncbi:hypothetical protein IV203_008755 [Nitzschia inconspicua]|uniref:Uncharacterized protein n=1 Tax=Nitzschia inconspicua TaxID=303405 RepID=A0A9K3PMB9_9STRA|nr:hypothetical protein IV203_008755 [Nitzschia inconspicua]